MIFIKQRPLRLDKCDLMTGFMERISEELPEDVKVPEVKNSQIEGNYGRYAGRIWT